MTYPVTNFVRFSGSAFTGSGSVDITRVTVNVGSFGETVTDGVDDNWTVNETITEQAGGIFDEPFQDDDAVYVGTITIGDDVYPVLYDAAGGGAPYYVVSNNSAAMNALVAATDTINPISTTPQAFSACFAAGTQIATPGGEVAVETLKIGAKVMTADGRAVPVKWVGYQDLFATSVTEDMQPVRIRAGALGENLPHTDLIVTSDHALALDGYLVDANALLNRETIDILPLEECGFRLRVFHIETEEHEVLVANGVGAESFLDAPDRSSFDNYDEYCEIYGEDRRVPEMPVPRIPSARLLPQVVRARLDLQVDRAEQRATEIA
ncbi:MAG: Hint domain-containing protein [Pseudomonadota bacterium]